MISDQFLRRFKRTTEARWGRKSINPFLYGFQFQRGTRWNAGLSNDAIAEYERVLGVQFPHDFKAFLRMMNGTDLPTLNVYGNCGEPQRESIGVYSYPRDIGAVKQGMEIVRDNRTEVALDLAEQGFLLAGDAGLAPIYAHRYLVCTTNPDSSVVLSIVVRDVDAVVYGNSLQEYLENEFLDHSV